jgi:CheY-like chemotaxis protein
MRYRIALNGFSEFEYRAMQFSFQHRAAAHAPAYEIVEELAKADFSVVDSDAELAVKMAVMSGRIDRTIFIGASAPSGATWHFQRPIDPNRILRALDELTRDAVRDPANGSAAASGHQTPASPPATIEAPWPTLPPIPSPEMSSLEAPPLETSPRDTPPRDTSPSDTSPTDTSPTEVPAPIIDELVAPATPDVSPAKSAARAASRRARLTSNRRTRREVDPLSDVLVLDADADASASLCTLLERFGFSAYSVRSIDKATEQLAVRPYAAMFLDMALDGPGLALLERIHGLPTPKGKSGPAVLMVAANVDPADQVRAALAGISAPLLKPLTRGIVARALEDSRVTLPADARRV